MDSNIRTSYIFKENTSILTTDRLSWLIFIITDYLVSFPLHTASPLSPPPPTEIVFRLSFSCAMNKFSAVVWDGFQVKNNELQLLIFIFISCFWKEAI